MCFTRRDTFSLHRAYSSSATIVLMSPVVELVIRETRRPFRLSEDSGLDYDIKYDELLFSCIKFLSTLTASAVSGGRMTVLRYFLAGLEVLAMIQRTERHGDTASFRLEPGDSSLEQRDK